MMFKKYLSLLLALLLTLSVLSGCADNKKPEETQGSTTAQTNPAATEPAETKPPVEETEPPVEIDYDNLVTDAYTDAISVDAGYTGLCCYHIPQFNFADGRADAVNAKIYDELYAILSEQVYGSDNEYPWLSKMVYSWGVKGDLVSVLVQTNMLQYEWTDFHIYTISIETGKEVSLQEFAAAYGMTEDDYYAAAKDTLKRFWDAEEAEQADWVDADELQALIDNTLSDSNVKASVPFINADGELCFVATLHWMAGAGEYYRLWNTGEDVEEGWIECTATHPAA